MKNKGWIRISRKKLFKLEQDISDMLDSRKTRLTRCSDCNRFYDVGLECPHCSEEGIYPFKLKRANTDEGNRGEN